MPATLGIVASHRTARAWTPASLPGLAAWWDASDAATVINPPSITVWNDKSGIGHHLTPATAGASKLYTVKGKPMVGTYPNSTTATELVNTTWTRQSIETIVGTFWINTIDGSYPMDSGSLWQQVSAGDRTVYIQGSTWYSGYNTFFPGTGPRDDLVHIYAAASDGATSWFDIDRVRTTGSNATTPPVGLKIMFDQWAGYSMGGPGIACGELIIVNGVMSSGDLTVTCDYLKTKWGTP